MRKLLFGVYSAVVISCVLMLTQPVWAQSDDFIIRALVGNDTDPPTTPSISSLTPVSTTQIDVVWGAVTDNVAVDGYQVFRDALQIATTSLTNYSDTGLTASTTYSYTIRAFDTSNNFSSTSAAVATTTLPVVVVATSTPTTTPVVDTAPSGSAPGLELLDLQIDTTERTASIMWETNRYAQYTFRYGRSSSYELGFVSNDVFNHEHTTFISDLEPGTTYEYELIGYNRRGSDFVLSRGQFTTAAADDVLAPANVNNLNATTVNGGVQLTWDVPLAADFSRVRIVRSHLFYPTDPYAGFVVYEGAGDNVFDAAAFSLSPLQYYTVFSYDDSGNVSSGAVVWIANNPDIAETGVYVPPFSARPKSTTTGAITPALSVRDIEFIQNNTALLPDFAARYTIAGTENLTVRIPYERLPEHLKAITVTLTHPDDASLAFSFLLRVNKDKTAYEATIAPLGVRGTFAFTLDVFDFKTELATQLVGSLHSKLSDRCASNERCAGSDSLSFLRPTTIILVTTGAIIGVALLVWLFLWRRRADTKRY